MTKTHATGSGVSYGMRYLLKMIEIRQARRCAAAYEQETSPGKVRGFCISEPVRNPQVGRRLRIVDLDPAFGRAGVVRG